MSVQQAVKSAYNRLHNVWAVASAIGVSVPDVLFFLGFITNTQRDDFNK